MERKIIITALILGLFAVILGAFGAHGLKEILSENQLKSFETGVRYQFYHAFFLLFLGGSTFFKPKVKKVVYFLVLIGVILFSGSIYLLAVGEPLLNISFKKIALITPFGGLLLISAWFLLLLSIFRNKIM